MVCVPIPLYIIPHTAILIINNIINEIISEKLFCHLNVMPIKGIKNIYHEV